MVRARWISASGMMRAAKFSSARRRSVRAWARFALADCWSWSSACIENSLLRAAARGLTASMVSRSWPFATRSPSLTASIVICPGMVAEMSTFFVAWTLPLAVTLAWMSSRPTSATSTSVGFGPRFE